MSVTLSSKSLAAIAFFLSCSGIVLAQSSGYSDPATADGASIDRSCYLIRIAGCNGCHTPAMTLPLRRPRSSD